MSTKRKLKREWERIRARADELHRLTGLAMYLRLTREADQQLAKLAEKKQCKEADHVK